MWRYDSQRSAASPDDLPDDLRLQWVRCLPKLKTAWPDQSKMRFDAAYEPIVAGRRLFLGSSHDNSVTAYDARTGVEIWKFFTDGPIRFAPAAWQDRLYVVSDDGYLYCLRMNDGSLAWRFRGGPSDRKILGNERLISTWPARGAPVIADGTIYFAAGIWPFMGIFLHALDAQSGAVVWTTDGDGSNYMKQPHNTDSFAGVAPQGALVAIGQKLLVPGGRSVPACYDRATGHLLYYKLAENAKAGGGSTVAAVDQLFFNGGASFDLATEKFLGLVGEQTVFAEGRAYDYAKGKLRVLDLATSRIVEEETIDRKGVTIKSTKWTVDERNKLDAPRLTALIKAGSRLFAGAEGQLLAWSIPLRNAETATPVWQDAIEGTPASLVAADDRLFAVTLEGELYCFGAPAQSPASPRRYKLPEAAPAVDAAWSAKVDALLEHSGVGDGYCLVYGVEPAGLISELVRHERLRIVVVEPDPKKAKAFRETLRAQAVGGDRVTVLVADPLEIQLPPYLASLAIANTLPASERDRESFIARVFASLRPYGGVACLGVTAAEGAKLAERLKDLPLEGAVWKPAGDRTLLVRAGALPESADWTHEHADAANTRVSKDKRVKTPLGLLWFGGPANDAVLPRHGHGPQPQVVDGRLFIEGVDLLRATDIYTGRLLWEASLPGVGALYDNTFHQPGANAAGTNYIATHDGVFVAHRDRCVQLDPATGKVVAEFALPVSPGTIPTWGYINVFEDYLIGGGDPLVGPAPLIVKSDDDRFSSSGRLVVLNRRNRKVLWSAVARSGFRHNAICIGGGRLYAIDRLSGPQLSRLTRRGEEPQYPPRLVVFDLKTGRELWATDEEIFGTSLSYSDEHDVLIETGRKAGDTLSDEPKGMRAYRGDGSLLWDRPAYSGPAMIHHDLILMAGNACNLLTGERLRREHPLSGEPVDWSWTRNYGCNTPMASEHLLTFRSGAAGYFDFCNDSGTGNFGGFRSSCSNNLVVAGGVLTAPDYTRTCTCSYQNQTSLAMVHMPDAEMWTSYGAQTPTRRVRRLGVNLGAPGDRKADDGTLWLDYPSVGGPSPALDVRTEPKQPEWFRRHSSQITGPGLGWVGASGALGLKSLKIRLAPAGEETRPYTVRLHFIEPAEAQPGERVFRVDIQGKTVVPALDVVKEAGAKNHTLVKEFTGVNVNEDLVIGLTPLPAAAERKTVLCGVEILAEGW